MFSFQELAIASGIDLERINPYESAYAQKLEMANQLVRKWMTDPENRAYLDRKKADYIHKKGWTENRGLKHECDIPQDAFVLLPKEIRNDKKALMQWVKTHHPYLLHSSIV